VFWRQQSQLLRMSRENSVPHTYARCAAIASKGASLAIPTVSDLALQLAKDDALGGLNEAAAQAANTPAKRKGKSFAEKREQREEDRQRHINEVIHHQFWTALDCSGQGLFSVSPKLRNYPFLQKLYLNHNNLQTLPESVTKLSQLRVLDLSGNQISQLPTQIRRMSSLRVLLLFDNKIDVLPYEIGCLFQLQMIGLLGNPWFNGSDLKESLTYKQLEAFTQGGTRQLVEYLRDMAPVYRRPLPRELVHLNSVTNPKNEISLMTYNTLCDVSCTPQVYAYTPSWALSWWHRKQLLVEEVLHKNMDIVCLQEVNVASLTDVWLPVMEPLGYKLLYYQKTRARTMSQQHEAKFVDGCATFYKHNKLTLVEKYPVEYNSKALLKDDLKKSEDIFNRVMTRDNIAIIGVFEVTATGRQMIVANTHLHWDPAFRDVKLVQTALLLEETEKMARKYAKLNYGNDLKKVPVLIAGDFNSTADSGVVQLFNHSSVPAHHEDMDGHTYGNFTEQGISHNLPLKSAYPEEVQLPFTNYTPDFVEVIDYMVYSTPTIKVNALFGKIDPEYVEHSVAFPDAHFPSDHICIGGHFEFL